MPDRSPNRPAATPAPDVLAVDAGRGRFATGMPRPGDRAPNATAVAIPGSRPVSLFDRYAGGGWTLLLFANPDRPVHGGHDLAPLARWVAEVLGGDVAPLIVLPPGASPDDRPRSTATVVDTAGAVAAIFGVTGEAAVLVRPDGYVGFRSAPVDDAALWDYLGAVFAPALMPSTPRG